MVVRLGDDGGLALATTFAAWHPAHTEPIAVTGNTPLVRTEPDVVPGA